MQKLYKMNLKIREGWQETLSRVNPWPLVGLALVIGWPMLFILSWWLTK